MYENYTNFMDRLHRSGLGGPRCCCCCCCCNCNCSCDCDCGCCGCRCGCGCGCGGWGREAGVITRAGRSSRSGLSGLSGRSSLSGLMGIDVGPDEKRGCDERTLTRRPMSVWLGFITRVLQSRRYLYINTAFYINIYILNIHIIHIFYRIQADIS